MSKSAFKVHLEELRTLVEAALIAELERSEWPESLKTAVQYSLMAGGKRLRPILVLLANDVCGGRREDAIPAACAIEMIHTYSLIHDDLPSMDDDDFRRGRPTSHKVFGEALAVLAGDCLLTQAFETLGSAHLSAPQLAESIRLLAVAAGGAGMVGGQVLDLEAERGSFLGPKEAGKDAQNTQNAGCGSLETAVVGSSESAGSADASATTGWQITDSDQNESNRIDKTRVVELTQIHKMKTGALIAGALELGAVSAAANLESRNRLRHYGHCIGLAFQIADDLLDVTGDQTKLGKKPGRDVDLGKLTYPSLLGIENSRTKADQLVQEACHAVDTFGARGVWLKDLARFIVERDH